MSRQQNHPVRRVLYLTWRDLDHPEGGGAEVFAERTSAELVRQGVEVTMFSSAWKDAVPKVERDGFTILRRGGRYTVYLRALAHLLRHRHRYDAVVDVQNGVPFWTPLVFRGNIVNVTHHVHREQWSSFFAPPIARLGWFLESKVAPWVYRNHPYVTVSQSSREDLVAIGIDASRISLAYSGVDLPTDYAETQLTPRSPHPTIVTVCRLVPHKRIEMAISAVAALSDSVPDLELYVVGDGFWLDRLKAHAQTEGVSDRVNFLGFVSVAEKHEVLARSWVMAMPSVKEGWGLTIIEAALHGTPTVAFRSAGGTRESIQDHVTGILADGEQDMLESLHRVLTDVDYRSKLGTNAREYAQQFNWPSTGQDLLTALEANPNS